MYVVVGEDENDICVATWRWSGAWTPLVPSSSFADGLQNRDRPVSVRPLPIPYPELHLGTGLVPDPLERFKTALADRYADGLSRMAFQHFGLVWKLKWVTACDRQMTATALVGELSGQSEGIRGRATHVERRGDVDPKRHYGLVGRGLKFMRRSASLHPATPLSSMHRRTQFDSSAGGRETADTPRSATTT